MADLSESRILEQREQISASSGPQEQRFEAIREQISAREESLREQFVTANVAADSARNGQFVSAAQEINREIDDLGKRFPQYQEALPPRIDVEQLERQLPAQNRQQELEYSYGR